MEELFENINSLSNLSLESANLLDLKYDDYIELNDLKKVIIKKIIEKKLIQYIYKFKDMYKSYLVLNPSLENFTNSFKEFNLNFPIFFNDLIHFIISTNNIYIIDNILDELINKKFI